MCGIAGCVLKSGLAAPKLHQSLKRLEYRGYDSAGIATISGGRIHVKKDKGKIDEIHRLLNLDDLPGSVGIAHCLHPDTYVLTATGEVVKVKDLPETCELVAYDFGSRRFVRAVGRVFRHRARRLLRIRTPSTEILVTGNHLLYVFDPAREAVVEKPAGEVRVGDLLILPEEVRVCGRSRELREVPARLYFRPTEEGWRLLDELLRGEAGRRLSRGLLSHLRRRDRNVSIHVLRALGINPKEECFKPVNSATNFVRFPKRTSPELMRLLGYYFGDGSVDARSVKFKDKDVAVLEEYREIIRRLFSLEGKIVKEGGNRYVLRVNSVYLVRWLRENFPELVEKRLPPSLGSLPDEEVYAFIGGLFDAEGTIGRRSKSVIIAISDPDAVRQLQMLLLRAGVVSSLRISGAGNGRKRPVARLQITCRRYIERFIERIGRYVSASKLSRVREVCEALTDRAYSFIKIPVEKRVLHGRFRQVRGRGFLTVEGLSRVKDPALRSYLSRYLEAPVVYQRVCSVEEVDYDGYVYDIEVDGGCNNFVANAVIQHNSRWATHGAPSKENAHPHLDCEGLVAVVHNGVIENFLELKEELEERGHRFVSRTDTEVIPHLIEEGLKAGMSLFDAVVAAVKRLRGSYAIAVISPREPDKMVCVRNESPLIVGAAEDGCYCASDIPAILPYTRRVVSLRNGEAAILTADGYVIRRVSDGAVVQREPQVIEWSLEMAEKQGYPHFMLKEIHEQPLSLRNALRLQERYLDLVTVFLDRGREVFLVGAGTSYHACLAASYMLSKLAKLTTYPVVASEFIENYGEAVGVDSVVLAVSQSGETYDTLKAADYARMRAATVIGITNTVGSTLTRISRAYIVQQSGPEIGVAATKTFTAQLIVLAQLALRLAKLRGKISQDEIDEFNAWLHRMPDVIEEVLRKTEDRVKALAKKYANERFFVFIGRGISTATALEGRLKLLEITYIPSLAYAAGESKHGPIAVIEEGVPVVCIVPNDETRKDMIGNIMEMRARGARIISLCEEGDEKVKELSEDVIEMPKGIPGILSPIPYVVPLQLFAYYMAVERGLDPDKPRNLAKSVTVP